MKRGSKKLTATIIATGLIVASVPAIVIAGTTNATGVAVNVTASLKSNTVSTFTVTSGSPLPKGTKVTCTSSITKFVLTTKGGGLGPLPISNPSFTGCTDNLGGTDTLTSNSTNGAWTSTYVNAATASASNMLKIGIPKAGQTLKSSVAPNCTLTVDPTAAGSVSGTYDNAGNFRITGAVINFSATGPTGACPFGTGTGTATFTTGLKTGGTGTPGFAVSPVIYGIH
jgi:hypothetical protein